ncbi:MAG TPA: uridylate kinase [Archaeoglobus veneficus]|nr:uridylate kinase [Archaeoglobus veneficus]
MELIKVGGSVFKELSNLIQSLRSLKKDIIIVPGGWIFADLVRELDKKYGLKEKISHWMAIACMDVYAYFIANFGANAVVPNNFSDLKSLRGINVILTHNLLRGDEEFNDLPYSWEVTSDSISVWLSYKLRLRRTVKVTDVDGVFIDGKLVKAIKASELLKLNVETCVDKFAPRLLKDFGIDMFVCNAKEVKNYILKGKAKGTLIKGE